MRAAVRAIAILVVTLVCGWLLVRWAYTPLRCTAQLTELTQRTDLASASSESYARLSRTRRNLEDLRAIDPQCRMDVRLYMLKAANEEMLGHYEDAVRSYTSALTVDRRPEIYTSLGLTLIRLGRLDEAAENYAVAARFTYPDPPTIPSEIVERRVAEILRAKR